MKINALIPPHVADAARGFSIVQRVSQVALAAGVCLMLHSPEAQGQAWYASQNPVFLNDNLTNVGIGTNSPQKTLHLFQAQKIPFVGDPNPNFCNTGLPTLRLSALGELQAGNPCPGITNTRINWDVEGSISTLNFKNSDVTRMVLTSGGNVGIGITNPNSLLSLGNSLSNTKLTIFQGASLAASAGIGWQSNQMRFHLNNTGSSTFSFLFRESGPELVRFNSSGRNGFGTTTPLNRMDINGALAVGNAYAGLVTAPPNGLIVAGQTGIGTSTVSGGTSLEVGGGAFAHLFSGSVGVGQAIWSRINLSNTVNINPSNFAVGAATFQNATSGSIYGLTSNREGGYIQNGVLNENGNVSPLVVYKSPLRPLVFASEGVNGALQETMSLSASGQMVLTGVSPTGFGSKLEVYGGNITQVSSGQPASQTPSDIFTSIGGRLGNQPPPQAPGINAQGLRVQWGQNGANFGMTDFDDPGQPTIKNALISWQDITATNLGQVQNRLVFGFRDATGPGGGGTNPTNFQEVATLVATGKSIFGVGTKVPGSFISSGNNMSVGTTYGNISAPLNSLIVEGRVGVGTSNPLGNFLPGTLDINGNPIGGQPLALHVAGGGVLCNIYGVGSDARIKRNDCPLS